MKTLIEAWRHDTRNKIVISVIAFIIAFACCSPTLLQGRPSKPVPTAVNVAKLQTASVQTVRASVVTKTSKPSSPTAPPTKKQTEVTAASKTATATKLPVVSAVAACIPNNSPQKGKVVDIVDGDTIKVYMDGVTYLIRYIGIDTPENTKEKEYYGQEATNRNAELVYAKEVILIPDVSDKDKYGRLLRYVIIENTFVNLALVQEGFATAIEFPPDTACAATFQSAEKKASSAKLGMWGTPPTAIVVAPVVPVVPPASSGGSGNGTGNNSGNGNNSSGNAVCACGGGDLDCGDFSSHTSAQACFDYCYPKFGDTFRLDADGDLIACESLP